MDTKLKDALRSYGGPLTPEQLQVLRDMQGWIEYCISNGLSLKSALGVLAHDVNGLVAEVPFLKPKVTGYAKYRTEIEDLSDLANDPNPNDE
ncbi:MAG: hypothetical protein QOF78_2068 [Phycisphaerales bacterium]|jgi:hypothetical protein|nr:hypothetical protein [Phycisphaerales bacterium]